MIVKYDPSVILLQELKIKKGDKVQFKGYNFVIKLLREESYAFPSIGMLIKIGVKYEIIDTHEDWGVMGVNILIKKHISLFNYYI